MKQDFDDLILRVRAVEAVCGSQALYGHPAGFNKKTVEKWLRRDSWPRPATLRDFCAVAGITVSEFHAPHPDLARVLARASEKLFEQERASCAFTEDQVLEIIGSQQKKGSIMGVLSETTGAIGKKTLEKYHQEFSGYYTGYVCWTAWDQPEGQTARLAGSAFRFLVQINGLDPEHNVIQARLTTHNHLSGLVRGQDKWAYHGLVVPLPGKLVFMFEVPNPSFEEMSYVFILAQNTPKDRLMGVLASDSSAPDSSPFMKVQPLPAASRVLLQKREGVEEKELMDELSYDRPIDPEILKQIKNQVHPDTGILMTSSLPTGTG